MISELFKKLSLAEKEINTLNQKLQDKCKWGDLPCIEHNDFQLNDTYLHCTICYELFIKVCIYYINHNLSLSLVNAE